MLETENHRQHADVDPLLPLIGEFDLWRDVGLDAYEGQRHCVSVPRMNISAVILDGSGSRWTKISSM